MEERLPVSRKWYCRHNSCTLPGSPTFSSDLLNAVLDIAVPHCVQPTDILQASSDVEHEYAHCIVIEAGANTFRW